MPSPSQWRPFWALVLPMALITVIAALFLRDWLHMGTLERFRARAVSTAKDYAARLDGRFRTVSQVARDSAVFLSVRSGLEVRVVSALLRSDLEQSPLILGAGVLYAPRPRKKTPPPVFVYRDGDTPRDLKLAVSYDREEWFEVPGRTGRGVWSDPMASPGDPKTVVSRYATPFFDGEGYAGVVVLDIGLAALQSWAALEGLSGQRFVLVSASGRFLSHPDPQFLHGTSVQELAKRLEWPELAALGALLRKGKPGAVRMERFATPEPYWVYFAPIPATGWMFAAATPEREVLAAVDRELMQGGAVVGGLLLLVVLGVALLVRHLSQPVRRLAGELGQLLPGAAAAGGGPIEVVSRGLQTLGRQALTQSRDLEQRLLAAQARARGLEEGERDEQLRSQALRHELLTREARIEGLERELAARDAALGAAGPDGAALEREAASLERAMEEARAGASHEAERAARLEQALAGVREDLAGREQALEQAERRVEDLEGLSDSLEAELEGLKRTLAEREARMGDLSAALAQRDQALAALEARLAQAQQERDTQAEAAGAREAALVQELSAAREALAEGRARLEAAHEEARQAVAGRDALEAQLAAAEQARAGLNEGLAGLREAQAKQAERLAATDRERTDLEAVVARLRASQQSLLPALLPADLTQDALQLAGVHEAGTRGGALSDFFMVAEGRWLLVVADYGGGEVVDLAARLALRTLVRDLGGAGHRPAVILEEISRARQAEPGGAGLSLLVVRYDPDSGGIQVANGGHSPPMWLDRQGAVHPLGETTGVLLGGATEYLEQQGHLEPGETLLLSTDALFRVRSPAGEPYREERLHLLLTTHAAQAPGDLCRTVIEALHAFAESEVEEDLTVLALRRGGGAAGETMAPGAGRTAMARLAGLFRRGERDA